MPSSLSITAATAEPALLDLPWHLPLEAWPQETIAALPKGLSRHTVRFAHLGDHVIAIKETLLDLAKREYEVLKKLEKLDVPCVEPFAIISNRKDEAGNELPAVLITRHLKFLSPLSCDVVAGPQRPDGKQAGGRSRAAACAAASSRFLLGRCLTIQHSV
jgi:hypothetical protein